MADRQAIGLSTAYTYAAQTGLSMEDVARQYDIEDDRDNPDTPGWEQHAQSVPVYGGKATGKGAATRSSGDVIDRLAQRNGGRVPSRAPEPRQNSVDAAFAGAKSMRAPTRAESIRMMLPDSVNRFMDAFIPAAKTGVRYGAVSSVPVAGPALAAGMAAYDEGPRVGQTAGQAIDDVQQGKYGDAVVHGIQSIPVVGAISQALEQRGSENDVAGAIGDTTGALAGGAIAHSVAEPIKRGGTFVRESRNLQSTKPTPASLINNAIGTGSIDAKRKLNTGDVLALADRPIDVNKVKNDPLELHRWVDDQVNRENLAADQLLGGPEGQAPHAHGPTVIRAAKPNVALLTPQDIKAAQTVDNYISARIDQLSRAHGPDNPQGMISAADADQLKRELNTRANWDKIFGKGSQTSSADVRNGIITHYVDALDQVGDTVPGYHDLNQRRSALIHFRDNVVPGIVESAPGEVPSRTRGAVNTTVGATRIAVGNRHGGMAQMGRGIAEMNSAATKRTASPTAIAEQINKAVEANRNSGAVHPAVEILNNADHTPIPDFSTELPVDPEKDLHADFAASATGDVVPTAKTINATQQPIREAASTLDKGVADREAQRTTDRAITQSGQGDRDFFNEAIVRKEKGERESRMLNGSVPMRADVEGGNKVITPREEVPYTSPTESTGIVKKEGLGLRKPRAPRRENPGFDPKRVDALNAAPIEIPSNGPPPPSIIDWQYLSDQQQATQAITGKVPNRPMTTEEIMAGNRPLDNSILPADTRLQDHRTAQQAREIAKAEGIDRDKLGAGDMPRAGDNAPATTGNQPVGTYRTGRPRYEVGTPEHAAARTARHERVRSGQASINKSLDDWRTQNEETKKSFDQAVEDYENKNAALRGRVPKRGVQHQEERIEGEEKPKNTRGQRGTTPRRDRGNTIASSDRPTADTPQSASANYAAGDRVEFDHSGRKLRGRIVGPAKTASGPRSDAFEIDAEAPYSGRYTKLTSAITPRK